MANKKIKNKEKDCQFNPTETELIKDLYKEVVCSKNKNKIGFFEIYLGEFDDDKTHRKLNSLEQLKKKGIIKSYSVERTEKTLKSHLPTEYDYEDVVIATAKCELIPQKIIDSFEFLFKRDKLYCEKLSSLLLKLVDITSLFFDKKINLEDKIKLNELYKKTVKNVNELLENNLIPYLKAIYKKPAHDLFYALKELGNSAPREQNNQLQFYYYTIQDFIEIYKKDINEKQPEKSLVDIEKYIKNLQEKIENTPVEIKGLEKEITLKKGKKTKILTNFPKDTKWSDIIIKFLNNEEVIITAKELRKQTNYEEMGFEDEKKKSPNKQWDFLKLLAIKNHAISWENNYDLSIKNIWRAKKQKQLLAESLKAYFQINDDPFFDYKKEKAYKIKINLIPESVYGNDEFANKIQENSDLDNENEEHTEEQRFYSGENNF